MSAGGAVVVFGAMALAQAARRAAQASAQRRLRAAQREHTQLNNRLGAMAREQGLAWDRPNLAAPRSQEAEELDRATEQARAEIARMRNEFTALTERRRDEAALTRMRQIDAALGTASGTGPSVRRQAPVIPRPAPGGSLAAGQRTPAPAVPAPAPAEKRVPTPASAALPATPDADIAAAEAAVARKLNRIDADVRVPDSLLELAAKVAREPAGGRPLLLARIDNEVRRLNDTNRRRRDEAVLLGEVELAAADLNDGPLAKALAVARADYDAERPVERRKLSAELEAAQRRERAALADAEAKAAIVRQFERLGYRVAGGFESASAEGGVLLRHGDARQHGMLVSVGEGTLDLEPVRLVERGQPEGRPRRSLAEVAEDTKAEKLLCDGANKAVDGLAADGIGVRSRHHGEPGAAQPRRVGVPTEVLRDVPGETEVEQQRPAERSLEQ